ncbi:MAG: nucleoside triphosphate pyrophosphohydrolase family protein [Candidatus Enterosoma sp.]|nr:nucleoside triphosphate pyrophosphohydrolase family protein [Bacilli bacterium]MDD7181524.1 nucleoside triphosphate pyrophosphohydrolase family protein [Bacilli bacterium]MDY3047999.1 nucleoside triphosphate pyrophosphohydrolase family protein [Candidatus Enterosoma sp.]
MDEKINFNQYQKEAFDLISEDGRKDMVLNGVLGLAGESGECCDIVKKNRFQGHELNKEHLIEELGDVMWYIAETASGLGVTLEEVAQYNLDKLHKRYHGNHFNKEDSIHRNEEKKD